MATTQYFLEKKSCSTPGFFPETAEPIQFHCKVWYVLGRQQLSNPKGRGKGIPWQLLQDSPRREIQQGAWFSEAEVRADPAG